MKATADQTERVAAVVRPLDTAERREAYRSGDFPRSETVKDLDKRYRWDLVNMTGWQTVCSLYDEGLNDTHVDTLLRSIVAPL